MSGIMCITENGKHTTKFINDGDSMANLKGPWRGDISNTSINTLKYTIRDKNGELIAEVNELNRNSNANLALLSRADQLLEELKNAVCIITSECRDHEALTKKANELIKACEMS